MTFSGQAWVPIVTGKKPQAEFLEFGPPVQKNTLLEFFKQKSEKIYFEVHCTSILNNIPYYLNMEIAKEVNSSSRYVSKSFEIDKSVHI